MIMSGQNVLRIVSDYRPYQQGVVLKRTKNPTQRSKVDVLKSNAFRSELKAIIFNPPSTEFNIDVQCKDKGVLGIQDMSYNGGLKLEYNTENKISLI